MAIDLSFSFFLLLFLGIGLWSASYAKKTTSDYLVAGKSLPPSLIGLSAIATNNSGFMFTGMIGTTYQMGLASIWLMVGWILGDLAVSLVSVKAIRRQANSRQVESFGSLLGHWQGRHDRGLQWFGGVLTILLLTLYASGQLMAASKATTVLLDWSLSFGVIVGAMIVLLYSTFGGIRASIWTDAAQSVVMIIGMVGLMIVGFQTLGGWSEIKDTLDTIPSDYLRLFPAKTPLGVLLFIVGWLFGGIAVIGQPHIVIRYMCLDREGNVPRMRFYYYGWFTLFYGATIVVGLLSRLVFPDATQFDQELALAKMAQEFLPGLFTGLMLAALFAAAMSTADSIILSCSAALTHDVLGGKSTRSVRFAKAMTATVLTIASLFAIYGEFSVFQIVLDAWGILGSAFVPIILYLSLGGRCSQKSAIIGCLIGMGVFLLFYTSSWASAIYAAAPGILAGSLYFLIVNNFSRGKQAASDESLPKLSIPPN